MNRLPEPTGGAEPPAERTLSSQQFELVIRRAAELQAREAEAGDASMTEAEALRIGRELGLSGQYLARALAEVHGSESRERGLLARWLGAGAVQAARSVAMDAPAALRLLEEHLVEREYMTVVRRFPDRLLLERATGMIAAMGRATSRLTVRHTPLNLPNLAVAVRPLEEGYAYVSLSCSRTGERAALAAGGVLGGAGSGGLTGAVLAVATGEALAAAAGLPLLAAAGYGAQALYARTLGRTHLKLESLLDRLEHGELRAADTRWSLRRR